MADGSLIFDTKVDTSGFKSSLAGLKAMANGSVAGVGKVLAGLGTAIVSSMTAIGGGALKASIDFESAFAGVRKTVDATEEEFEGLRSSILNMSKEMKVVSPDELAGLMEIAGQLGIQTENLEKFSKTMVMLGEATNLSREEAATSLARFANVMGTSQKDFDRLGSTIVALGNNFATTEKEIVEMAGRLSGAGKQINLTEADVLAFSTALSSVGVNAEAGGSSLSRTFSEINTTVLSGGKHLSGFAKVAGMSAEEFSEKWKTKPAEAMQAFVVGLDKVKASGGDVAGTLAELGINGTIDVQVLSKLASANGELSKALDMSSKAYQENMALAEEFAKKLDTVKAKLGGIQQKLKVLSIAVGDSLIDGFKGTLTQVEGFVDQLASAFDMKGFDGLANAMGDIIPQMLKMGFDYLPEMMRLGGEFIVSLGRGFASNASSMGEALAKATSNLVNGLLTSLPYFASAGIKFLTGFIQGFSQGVPTMTGNFITSIIGIAENIIAGIPAFIDAGLNLLKGLAQGIADNLPLLIEKVPELINKFCNSIFEKIPDILKAGFDIIVTLGKGLIQAIPTLIANLPQILMAIVNVFTLFNFAGLGKSLITKLGSGLKSMVGYLKANAGHILSNLVGALKLGLALLLSLGAKLVSMLVNGLKSGLTWLYNTGIELVEKIKTSISNKISEFIQIGKNIIDGIVQGILNMGHAIIDTLGGIVDGAIKWVKSKLGIHSPSRVFKNEIGKQIGAGLALGIKASTKGVIASSDTLVQASILPFIGIGKKLAILSKEGMSLYEESLKNKRKDIVAEANKTGYALLKAMAKAMKGADLAEKEAFLERADKFHKLKIAHIGVAYKVYQDRIAQEEQKIAEKIKAIDNQIAHTKNKSIKANLRVQKKLLDTRIDDLKAFEKSFTSTFDKMVEDYSKAIDGVMQKSEAMKEKLLSYGDLVKEIKSEEPDGVSSFALANLSEQINTLKTYGDILGKIEARGADTDVLNKLQAMSVDDAIRYGELLLAQSAKDWDIYMAQMAEKRALAEKLAKEAYAKELDSFDKNFTKKANENLENIRKGAGQMGVKSAKALADGFKENAHFFKEAVSRTVAEAMAEASEAMGLEFRGKQARQAKGDTHNSYTSSIHVAKIETKESASSIARLDEKLGAYNRNKLRGQMG